MEDAGPMLPTTVEASASSGAVDQTGSAELEPTAVPAFEKGDDNDELVPSVVKDGDKDELVQEVAQFSEPSAIKVPLPREGVDWANRWAELENATEALASDRDALRVEVAQLRRQKVDQTMKALDHKTKESTRHTKEFQELQVRLDAERRRAERHLGEVVDEQKKCSALSEELQQRTADLAKLSAEKLQLQTEKQIAESQLSPVRCEHDRKVQDLEVSEKRCAGLQTELDQLVQERDTIFREKADLQRELTQQLSDAKADATMHEQMAKEAQEAEKAAQQQARSAEQCLRERSEAFDTERTALEGKMELRGQQLSRLTELRKVAQQQLEDALRGRDAALDSQATATKEAEELRGRLTSLEEALSQLHEKHEVLLRRQLPGVDATPLPEGFSSVSELFHEVTRSREEAMQERHAKEELQEVLRQIEHEVRTRYPALVSQRDEAEKLRNVAELLTQQNEGLLVQVQELEAGKREAEAQMQKAEKSQQVLESHARDIAGQLAVLLHENRRLSDACAKSNVTLETSAVVDRSFFRTAQELTQQNEALRRSLAKLTEKCKASAHAELEGAHEEQGQQLEEWKRHLEEKAAQMKVLVETVERITKERDEARKALKDQDNAPAPAQPAVAASIQAASAQVSDSVLRDQLRGVREEFAKCTELLHKELREIRTAELSVRRDLASAQGQLDFEASQRSHLQTSLKTAEAKLKERQKQIQTLERRAGELDTGRQGQEATLAELEAKLGQANRNLRKQEMQVRLERKKVGALEQQNSVLLEEKAKNVQLTVDLYARLAQEEGAYTEMRKDLESSHMREQQLLQEQLDLSKQRQDALKKTAEELNTARTACSAEAAEAKATATELREANDKLQEQVSLRNDEIQQLQKAGSARPRRGAEVATEALEQLGRSQAPRAPVDLKQLQERLRVAEERQQHHIANEQFWQTLLKTHEADLKARQEEVSKLQSSVEALQRQRSELEAARDEALEREQRFERRLQELGGEAAELRASVDRKDAEVAAARLDGEKKAHEAVSRLETAKRESAGSTEAVEEWQQRHREAVCSHGKDIQVLEAVKERCAALERDNNELHQRCGELAGDAAQARTERASELELQAQKLQQAEQHAKALSAEVQKYREHVLSASQQRGGTAQSQAETGIQQQAVAELKKAREISELQQQELELDRARLQREVKASRAEALDLQRRLDGADRELLQAKAELRHRERAVVKIGQMGLVEDDNRRLMAEVQSMEAAQERLRSEAEAKALELEPLQREVRELRKREEDADRTRKGLESDARDWKQRYSEVVTKFNAHDVHEFNSLKEESARWQQQRGELSKRNEQLMAVKKQSSDELKQCQEELKQLKSEVASSKGIKEKHDELQKAVGREREKFDELDKKHKEDGSRIQRMESLKILWKKRMDSQEAENTKLKEAIAKLKEEMEKRTPTQNIAALKKAEEEAKSALTKAEEEAKSEKGKADKTMGLAMDYQRCLMAAFADNKELEQRLARTHDDLLAAQAAAQTAAEGRAARQQPQPDSLGNVGPSEGVASPPALESGGSLAAPTAAATAATAASGMAPSVAPAMPAEAPTVSPVPATAASQLPLDTATIATTQAQPDIATAETGTAKRKEPEASVGGTAPESEQGAAKVLKVATLGQTDEATLSSATGKKASTAAGAMAASSTGTILPAQPAEGTAAPPATAAAAAAAPAAAAAAAPAATPTVAATAATPATAATEAAVVDIDDGDGI